MTVLAARLELRLPGCCSLKEKRHVLRGLVERARHTGASVAEVGDQDLWGNASVGVAVVDSDAVSAQARLAKAVALFEGAPEVEVEAVQEDVLLFS